MILLLILMFFSWGVHGENSTNVNEMALWDTVKNAYVYSYPLVLMDAMVQRYTNTVTPTNVKAPVNQFIYNNIMVNADFKDVVSPNVDTMYSGAFLDLNKTALVFVKPKTDRFCSAQIFDAYTNTVDVIGSGGDAKDPLDEQICLITGKDYQGDIPEGMKQISVPTDIAWLLVRIIDNGPDDLPNIETIQSQMVLVPLKDYLSNQTYVPPNGTYIEKNDFIPPDHVRNMSPDEFFNTANRLMITNPPTSADARVIATMKSLNVGPGLTFDEKILGKDSTWQWNSMLDSLVPVLNKKCAKFMLSTGKWKYFGDPVADFGTEYDYRALIAFVGFGANPPYVAIYPKTDLDSNNQQLSGNNSYKIHFDKGMLPPVLNGGFWSITVYDSDNLLIANEINRYCINDRTNLTYNPDGSLDILLRAETPGNVPESNRLPVGTGDFHLFMRVYLPDMEKISTTWAAPDIVKQ